MPRFKGKRKTYRKKKPVARKRVDKYQNKQLAQLKKDVQLLKTVQEPQRMKMPYPRQELNGCMEAAQHRLTKNPLFIQKSSSSGSVIDESVFRTGDQLNIGNINLHLTLWDINNAFRWRMLVVQYQERTDLHRVQGNAENYNANGELDRMLRWHDAPTDLSNLERLNYNIISPLKLKKDMRDSVHVLYDKTFTGDYRSIKVTGCDNQIVTKRIVIKPKMRKLTFGEGNHDSPFRGDIVAYIWNDLPYSGTRHSGYLGLEQTEGGPSSERRKGYSLFCEYNIYDDN